MIATAGQIRAGCCRLGIGALQMAVRCSRGCERPLQVCKVDVHALCVAVPPESGMLVGEGANVCMTSLCVGMLSSCVGLLEELRHEISVGDTTLAKVTVKVIMRGKQGAGKSSFVAACCGDAVLGDDYMKTVGLQVRTTVRV